jgi:spore coat protein CotH
VNTVPIFRTLLVLSVLAVFAGPASAQNTDALFDDTVLHEVYLEMNPGDWEFLKRNYFDNTYYPANFRWNGQTADSSGIRSRGSGSRSGDKPGLRVDFDHYEKHQRFLSLKSVILDNVVQDFSLIKERLTMSLFRRMGIPASRETHTRLHVNGKFVGVYVIVESVDKAFLKRELGEDGGHLYEYKWTGQPYHFEFQGGDGSLYVPSPFKPETHEDDPKPEFLVEFIRFANESSDEDFQARIGEFLDVRRFARHLAVENFVSEIDGITGYAGMNNLSLYRFKASNKWQFIPWDKDRAFAEMSHPALYNISENALTRRLMNLPEFRDALVGALLRASEIAGGSGGWLEQEVERLSDQIRTAVYADPFPKCPNADVSCSAQYFEAEVERLRQFAMYRPALLHIQMVDLGMITTPAEP